MKRMLNRWLLPLLLGLMLAGNALAAEALNAVGRVSDSEAFIAVVSTGSKAMAYVCDGAKISLWFTGAVSADGSLEVKQASGAKLSAKLSGGAATGTLELEAGKPLGFRTEAVREAAGLYRARTTLGGNVYLGGWIVLANGEQRGNVVGGGTLFERVTLAQNPVRADLPNIGALEPFLVTPAWVEQNVTL